MSNVDKVVEILDAYWITTGSDIDEWNFSDLAQQIEALYGWVSVEDRLPKWGEPVIAYDALIVAEMAYANNDEGIAFVDGDGYLNLHVTHWQPLPKPPNPS